MHTLFYCIDFGPIPRPLLNRNSFGITKKCIPCLWRLVLFVCNSVLLLLRPLLLPLTLSMSCGAEHYILWFIDIIVVYFATFYIYEQIVRHTAPKGNCTEYNGLCVLCVCAICVAIPCEDIVSISCSDFVNVSSVCRCFYTCIRASDSIMGDTLGDSRKFVYSLLSVYSMLCAVNTACCMSGMCVLFSGCYRVVRPLHRQGMQK